MEQWEERLIKYHKLFQRYPEPGWMTFFATIYLAETLQKAGYEVFVGREITDSELPADEQQLEVYERLAFKFAREAGVEEPDEWTRRLGHRTGVVAILDTHRAGEVKAFRFSMDKVDQAALGGQLYLPSGGKLAGGYSVMLHTGGHMALGLALACELAEEQSALRGKYIFVFQPADAGGRGDFPFAQDWKYGRIDKLYCSRVGFCPKYDTAGTSGEFSFVAGARGFLAASRMDIQYMGRPPRTISGTDPGRNALLAASAAVLLMEEIKLPGDGLTRLNVGRMQAGESRSTIPTEAWMQMEICGETMEKNRRVGTQVLKSISQAARRYDVDYRIVFRGESISAASDECLAAKVIQKALDVGGFRRYLSTWVYGTSDDGAAFLDMVQKEGGLATYMLFTVEGPMMQRGSENTLLEQLLRKAYQVLYKTALEI